MAVVEFTGRVSLPFKRVLEIFNLIWYYGESKKLPNKSGNYMNLSNGKNHVISR